MRQWGYPDKRIQRKQSSEDHIEGQFMASTRDSAYAAAAAAAAKSLQSCLTLCDNIDGSPPGSAVPGILQARTLEWVAISFSSAWKWKVKVKSLSHVWLLATPWTAGYQAPPSMRFSRQEYWSGCHCLLPPYARKPHILYYVPDMFSAINCFPVETSEEDAAQW